MMKDAEAEGMTQTRKDVGAKGRTKTQQHTVERRRHN